MKDNTTTAWQQYEAGKEYKQSIGLYETVRRNQRFYAGDQWHGVEGDLPKPVFNIVRRITDYLVSAIFPGDISIAYADEKIPFLDNARMRNAVKLCKRRGQVFDETNKMRGTCRRNGGAFTRH